MRNALAIRPLSFAALAFLLAEGIGCDSSQPCELGPYQDPAPHQAGRIEISDGMQLHYLDFGGTGPALLLLAGAGDSAHVFDDFAPRLTDAFRVLALTRRGFGESDRPATTPAPWPATLPASWMPRASSASTWQATRWPAPR